MMLGLFLIFSTVLFIGTVSDKLTMKNEISKIRKILQTASLSAAKYYNNEEIKDTHSAENIARGVISQTTLGAKINTNLIFDWHLTSNPKYLIVKLPSYTLKLFWFKFLGWDSKNVKNMSSKANIVDKNPTDQFAPIAINGCNKEFTDGENLRLLLGDSAHYIDSSFSLFFPLSNPVGGGHSEFAHWKNAMGEFVDNGVEFDFNSDFKISVENPQAADIKQLAGKMGMNSFSPINATIAVLDCGSTADQPIIKENIAAKITAIQCSANSSCCMPSPMSWMCAPMFCIFNEVMQEFTDQAGIPISWTTNKSQCGKDLFEMDITLFKEKKVILEY